MSKVLIKRDGRIARIVLNRPERLNAIDDEVPVLLQERVREAEADDAIHVIVLSGAGDAFCAGYDLTYYAEAAGGDGNAVTQEMPWDPMVDYRFMWANTQRFMSLWRCTKPVIAKVHGHAVAGGSDIALCCDFIVMEESAKIGYMPARVWGCPTTAMWTYRIGAQNAKRMLMTGDKIDGREAVAMGLALSCHPPDELDEAVDRLARRMESVPRNQLAMQKLVINQAIEAMGLNETQRLATIFDGITRHSPEGLAFKATSERDGWKAAVDRRDRGTWDWTRDRPINPRGSGE